MMKSSMSKIEPDDVNGGPVVSEGGRSPSTGHRGGGQGALVAGQRWSVGRKREVVLRLLRGESVELLSRELGVALYKLEQWRQRADTALDGALKEREADPASGELAAAMQRVGELSMEIELLRSRIERPGPLGRRRSR
jgi:transposase